jgi:putative tryptophan/tyrosine transport system substrate-binding protein
MRAPRATVTLALALGALFGAVPGQAQPVRSAPRVGLLIRGVPGPANIDACLQGLRELGYVEGQNVIIEPRYAEDRDDRLPALAAGLVRDRVDVIVAWGGLAVDAAQRATREIPIVIAYTSDPVKSGWVASLARPGGNVTGLSANAYELAAKRLELLKEIVPGALRVAVLFQRADKASAEQVSGMEPAASALGVTLRAWNVDRAAQMGPAFASMASSGMNALIVVHNVFMFGQRREILRFAAARRLPAIYQLREWADTGGLLAYGPSQFEMSRRAARYVDRILKGAKPADLPVEQPTKFELIVNLKTAKALSLTIPPSVLARADEMIE